MLQLSEIHVVVNKKKPYIVLMLQYQNDEGISELVLLLKNRWKSDCLRKHGLYGKKKQPWFY